MDKLNCNCYGCIIARAESPPKAESKDKTEGVVSSVKFHTGDIFTGDITGGGIKLKLPNRTEASDAFKVMKATNYEPEPQYIFHVEVARLEDDSRAITILCLDLTFGKSKTIKILVNPNESFMDIMFNFIEVIDEYRPTQIMFDTNGIGVGLKDEFIGTVGKSYIAMEMHPENGVMFYHRLNR